MKKCFPAWHRRNALHPNKKPKIWKPKIWKIFVWRWFFLLISDLIFRWTVQATNQSREQWSIDIRRWNTTQLHRDYCHTPWKKHPYEPILFCSIMKCHVMVTIVLNNLLICVFGGWWWVRFFHRQSNSEKTNHLSEAPCQMLIWIPCWRPGLENGDQFVVLLMDEIQRSPVEVGSLSHYLLGFLHPRWLAGFLNHQQYGFIVSFE